MSRDDFNKVYHLSHIDLDGYGCQYLTKKVFDNIECFNANYGAEVLQRLVEIVDRVKSDYQKSKDLKPFILITDLNLTTKECNSLERDIRAIGVDAKFLLLDHHITGMGASENISWYYLDTTRSATKITYDWLRDEFNFDSEGKYSKIVDAINAIDIWLEDSPYFEFGRVLIGMISGAREINRVVFAKEDRAYKFELIDKAREILENYPLEEAPIIFDDKLHFIKKDFFKKDKNDTKDNLIADFITDILTRDRDKMSVTFKGYKGLVTYSTGNTSLIGNNFLIRNGDFDFYMDVSPYGSFSLRSNNKVDVSKIAEIIGNGGGHPNAGGGKIEGYRDSFVYEKFRDFIQDYLKEREYYADRDEIRGDV